MGPKLFCYLTRISVLSVQKVGSFEGVANGTDCYIGMAVEFDLIVYLYTVYLFLLIYMYCICLSIRALTHIPRTCTYMYMYCDMCLD